VVAAAAAAGSRPVDAGRRARQRGLPQRRRGGGGRAGRIDILVNNAGVIRDNVLVGLEDEDIRTVLDVNVAGVFNASRAVAPFMISRRAGRIVNLSSVSGAKAGAARPTTRRARGDRRADPRARRRARARKINVNAVAPGVIETR